MQESVVTNAGLAASANDQGMAPVGATMYSAERLRELIAALEVPFDAGDIKWRVTNTVKVGTRNGPVLRGQVLAYADPRAYMDRLNEVFGPAGWTRDYTVQMVQNFERKERAAMERTITAKIVVTCKLAIHGIGAHTGLGEEWADKENGGTAAEAQAFKRASSCFGLGRYLYDLEGQWVDVDENKRPLEVPRLPDWARPKPRQGAGVNGHNGLDSVNAQSVAISGSAAGNRSRGLYRDEVLGQVKALSQKVGFSLSRSVLRATANVDDPDKIQDMARLTDVFAKLQDTARKVDRLRKAVEVVGDEWYSVLCHELNLASESMDDIPDRTTLHLLVERLDGEAGREHSAIAGSNLHGGQHLDEGQTTIGELRGRLLRSAARVSDATRRTLAAVVQEASNGTLSLTTLKTLKASDIGKVRAALAELQRLLDAQAGVDELNRQSECGLRPTSGAGVRTDRRWKIDYS